MLKLRTKILIKPCQAGLNILVLYIVRLGVKVHNIYLVAEFLFTILLIQMLLDS